MGIFSKIFEAKLSKNKNKTGMSERKLLRRTVKLGEESGEVFKAVFGITSEINPKNLSYDDLREELVDTIIVAADMLFTTYPDEIQDQSFEELLESRSAIFDNKIDKWLKDKKPAVEKKGAN